MEAGKVEKKGIDSLGRPYTRLVNVGNQDGGEKGHAARLREEFNRNTNRYVGKTFTNKATGVKAVFSQKSQRELRSRTENTKNNGFALDEHFEVANQIIDLFENADLPFPEHDDFKNNDKNLKIKRFLSKEVVLKSGKKVKACITVKHTLLDDKHYIYSIELWILKARKSKQGRKEKKCLLKGRRTGSS